jgi:hypothetical protein
MTTDLDPRTDPIATDLPDDTKYVGDRLDRAVACLEKLVDATVREETPAKSAFFANTPATGRNDFPQAVRTRLDRLVLSPSAACTITVRIGSAIIVTYNFAGALTVDLPSPVPWVDGGIDVVITASAGTLGAAYFTGYVETALRS